MSKIKDLGKKIAENKATVIKAGLITLGVVAGTVLVAAFAYRPDEMDVAELGDSDFPKPESLETEMNTER